jgi:hypothetical protein
MKKSVFIFGILFSAILSSFGKARIESSELICCWSFSEFNEGFHWAKTPVTFADYTGTWKMPNSDFFISAIFQTSLKYY